MFKINERNFGEVLVIEDALSELCERRYRSLKYDVLGDLNKAQVST